MLSQYVFDILFYISDLVNGLLCCSAPAYGPHHDLNMTLLDEQQQQQHQQVADWPRPAAVMDKTAAEMLMDKTASLDKMAAATANNWREDRTVEWVMESQQRMMMVAACRVGGSGGGPKGGATNAYCGQDCGDGFCYNVWNNMVPV